jgi:DNA-binding response OmpR family regulator
LIFYGVIVRLLVVEDEVGIATALQRGFSADGFDVDTAGNGTDGLRLARDHAYDAIVLDIMLPGLNGYEMCQALRSDGNPTPILMLTAKDADDEQVLGLDTGADDYVVKPFSYVVLLSRVRALIRRFEQDDASSVIAAGDLRLDVGTRTACRGDQPVDLSPKAFAVLTYLLEHAGSVVSKESILTSVWGHAFEGDANIVEVYISRIRQAIDAPFGRNAVQTIRGLGYRLEANGG